jgi:hypothetical protein
MNRSLWKRWVWMVAVAFLAGCATVSTQYDYDRETDFSLLQSYRWLPVKASEEVSELTVRRIERSVDAELAEKGYQSSASDPDFLLAAHIGKKDKLEVVDWGYAYYPAGRYYGTYYLAPRRIDVYEYQEGTLILDVIDAQSRHLVWRGTATAAIQPNLSPEQREQRIRQGVRELLSQFPPPAPR